MNLPERKFQMPILTREWTPPKREESKILVITSEPEFSKVEGATEFLINLLTELKSSGVVGLYSYHNDAVGEAISEIAKHLNLMHKTFYRPHSYGVKHGRYSDTIRIQEMVKAAIAQPATVPEVLYLTTKTGKDHLQATVENAVTNYAYSKQLSVMYTYPHANSFKVRKFKGLNELKAQVKEMT